MCNVCAVSSILLSLFCIVGLELFIEAAFALSSLLALKATESLVSSYVSAGVLPSIPHGEVLLFASVSAVVLGLYKSGQRTRQTAEKVQQTHKKITPRPNISQM